MVIKGVLQEELQNSLQMKKRYEEEIAKLPKGSLIKKKIKGYDYYYVVLREKGKVKFIYKGRKLPLDVVKKYSEAKKLRAKYRNSLSQVKKQISFLKKSLKNGTQAS
jgi:sRNA-binding regulator protein Hfq